MYIVNTAAICWMILIGAEARITDEHIEEVKAMGDTEYICNTLRATRTHAQIEAERKRAEHRRRQAQAIERNRRIRRNSTHCDRHESEINRGQYDLTA